MPRRVEFLREAAESLNNPFARLKAIVRADDLAGIITRKDGLGKKGDKPRAPQPMFVLPPGSHIRMSRKEPPAVIDVTVEDGEND